MKQRRFLWLVVVVLVASLGATQAWSRPTRCNSDRDCRHIRGASCGEAGYCVHPTQPIDPCKMASCATGSYCVASKGSASCVDPCDSNPCLNGATCHGQDAHTAVCTCAAGFTGGNCSQNVNDCQPDPCQNGGACADLTNDFTCDCPNGWTGSVCQTRID